MADSVDSPSCGRMTEEKEWKGRPPSALTRIKSRPLSIEWLSTTYSQSSVLLSPWLASERSPAPRSAREGKGTRHGVIGFAKSFFTSAVQYIGKLKTVDFVKAALDDDGDPLGLTKT
jgi:hypothetical protein